MLRFAILATLLIGCVSDDAKPTAYEYNCTCSKTCDSRFEQSSTLICASPDDINAELRAINESCEAELAPYCVSYSCSCSCPGGYHDTCNDIF